LQKQYDIKNAKDGSIMCNICEKITDTKTVGAKIIFHEYCKGCGNNLHQQYNEKREDAKEKARQEEQEKIERERKRRKAAAEAAAERERARCRQCGKENEAPYCSKCRDHIRGINY
jgi:3-hydroxy-3-methylglutaryl CoA synthase